MTAPRSLAFNLCFFAWTALVVIFGLPLLLFPWRAAYALGRIWIRVSLWLLAVIVGLRHEVRGLEHRAPEPAIFASKHQSAWDTLIFPLLLREPAYVLKQELTLIPLFGWLLRRAGHVAVDRAGGTKALLSVVAEARRAIAEGRSLLIFPEGTRAAPDRKLPYQPGVAALYSKLGMRVVPVALNSGLFWGRRSFRKRPGVITLEFLPAIAPGLDRKAFMQELERRIETASARLASAPVGLF